jgi:hypothetical protein
MNNTILYLEGALYTLIAVGGPLIETLGSDRPLTSRTLVLVAVTSIVSGANALKAFLSTSFSRATGDAVLVRDTPPPSSETAYHIP